MKTYPLETVQAALTARRFSGRTAAAVKQVLVAGSTIADAAAEAEVDAAAVSRMLTKLSVKTTCQCCGHTSKEIKL